MSYPWDVSVPSRCSCGGHLFLLPPKHFPRPQPAVDAPDAGVWQPLPLTLPPPRRLRLAACSPAAHLPGQNHTLLAGMSMSSNSCITEPCTATHAAITSTARGSADSSVSPAGRQEPGRSHHQRQHHSIITRSVPAEMRAADCLMMGCRDANPTCRRYEESQGQMCASN